MLAILENGFYRRMGQPVRRRKTAEPVTVQVQRLFEGAEPHPPFPVALDSAQPAPKFYLDRMEGVVGIVPEPVTVP